MQIEVKIVLFNPTADVTNYAADIYVNGDRTSCGNGMSLRAALRDAVDRLKDEAVAEAIFEAAQHNKQVVGDFLGTPIIATSDHEGMPVRYQQQPHKTPPIQQRHESEVLRLARKNAADTAWEDFEAEGIKDFNGWDIDGDCWSRKIYWEGEDFNSPSRVGSFGVRFAPSSNKIIDRWHQ